MPRSLQAWYTRDDLEALADREVSVRGELAVGKLTRLAGLAHAERSQAVAVTLAPWHSDDRRLMLTLSLQSQLVVACQRCLEPMSLQIEERLDFSVADSEADAERSGRGESSVVLDSGRLDVEALVEDELIVALPMAPRHESVDDCGPLAQNLGPALSDAAVDRVVGSREV